MPPPVRCTVHGTGRDGASMRRREIAVAMLMESTAHGRLRRALNSMPPSPSPSRRTIGIEARRPEGLLARPVHPGCIRMVGASHCGQGSKLSPLTRPGAEEDPLAPKQLAAADDQSTRAARRLCGRGANWLRQSVRGGEESIVRTAILEPRRLLLSTACSSQPPIYRGGEELVRPPQQTPPRP